jgi:NTE family protein
VGKVTLVLSGGGLRGLAHIGVLRAMRALGVPVHEYIGTSMGSLICALAAGGLEVREMEQYALSLKSTDILDLSPMNIITSRFRAGGLHRGERLHEYIQRIIPIDSFKLLEKPLLVNSVDLDLGEEVYWGSEGRDEIPIHDAVYSSCAIPGIFPPLKYNGSYFVDGGVGNNLPVHVAYKRGADLIIAVMLGVPPRERDAEPVANGGIINIILQSTGIMMRRMLELQLKEYYEYPLILIEPRASSRRMFDFDEADRSIRAGERAALNVLRDHPLLSRI